MTSHTSIFFHLLYNLPMVGHGLTKYHFPEMNTFSPPFQFDINSIAHLHSQHLALTRVFPAYEFILVNDTVKTWGYTQRMLAK